MTRYERLVAPRDHLECLVEPAGHELRAAALAHASESGASLALLDTTAGELRRELLATLELSRPVVLSGHQAEFFHAGVFAKSLAALTLAAQLGGSAAFLTVDSDEPKATALLLPVLRDGRLNRERIAIPQLDQRRAVECQPAASVGAWRAWFQRLRTASLPARADLLDVYERGFLSSATSGEPAAPLGRAAAFGRAAVEEALAGAAARNVWLSELASTRAFRVFAADCALRAKGLAEAYNAAQREVRLRRKMRNPARPAPLLAIFADRVESPFWLVSSDGVRRRLFVARDAGRLAWFAEQEHVASERIDRLARFDAHSEPLEVERRGWRLRPRALTLSAFARLLLCDVFLHGIGGAKYDEMTELFIETALGARLAPMGCVTATIRLAPPLQPSAAREVACARQALLDLVRNPDRALAATRPDVSERRAALLEEGRRLRAAGPHRRAARRDLFLEMKAWRAELAHAAAPDRARADARLQQAQELAKQDAIAADREYFFALHPRATLAELDARLRQALHHAG